MSANERRTDPSTVADQANRVIISYRAPETEPGGEDGWWIADSTWIQDRMTEPAYLRYLHWAHAGPVKVGEEWHEFVNCGCESPQDVILQVEEIHGGPAIGSETELEIVPLKGLVDG